MAQNACNNFCLQALVEAKALNDDVATCDGSVVVVAQTGPVTGGGPVSTPGGGKCGECARTRCYFGSGRDVKPCCNPNQKCYRFGRVGFCSDPSRVSRAGGEVVPCTKK